MFEVGFTEIVLILGLALLVLGPEKLPGLAEKVGRWTGRARAMARQLRTQLEQEVTLDEMTKSRPMQAPPPASEPSAASTNTTTTTSQAEPTAAAPAESTEPQAPSDKPHNASGLDLQTMVSGMEPPPQSAAETPANKAVQ
ncbi:Sec-independent protein translocase protein TatB [Steroidobacter sp.]|uniref:Sec-independent protein translocase protein TatB n=1 Tax=Steroidobacter sp. TaxID=1978227 RepID=UPI001A40DE91|nr:Sec-independent protein translocase protein TatB [Steroidobacter sp.]MBL8271719.1 twin-arginine translocase subunit TatB [Steroidobacter sp.]